MTAGPVNGLRFLRRAVIAQFVLIIALAGVAVAGFLANQQSTHALCVLRGDLERRVVISQKFLEKNPDGIPGIPASVIRDGIANRERTIRALEQLHCR